MYLAAGLGAAVLLAGSMAMSARRLPGVIFVNAAATGANDGSSWADAYVRLTDAIAAASPGDQVWVAAGRYTPGPAPSAGGSRDASFVLKNRVALYGGFAGGETSLSQRDWTTNRTILSGDLTGNDGPQFTNRADNAYHVVVALNVDDSAVVDGFTISGGHADGPGFGPVPESREQGSGINVYASFPRFANCVIEDNWSANHGAMNDHGSSTLVNCTFRNNFSLQFGAGLYMHFDSATTATGCRFEGNVATTDGGGAYSRSSAGAVLVHCVFLNNRAQRGAGFYNTSASTATVRASHFSGNDALIGGGGLYSDASSPRVIDCIFTANLGGAGVLDGAAGGGGSGGGGLWASGGAAEVRGCHFSENVASFGAGVYNNDFAQTTVTSCTFLDNTANEGAGLYALFSDVAVSDCTFIGNAALDGLFSVGGGLSTYFCSPTIARCTFIANTASVGGGALYSEGEAAQVRSSTFHGNRAVGGSNCCGSNGWGGAIMFGYFTTATVANCLFTGNRADLGGAVFTISHAEPRIVHATFAGNAAVTAGGAVFGYGQSAAAVANSVLWNNAPAEQGGEPADISFSCIRAVPLPPGAGNTNADPRLLRLPSAGPDEVWGTGDDDYGDLRLGAGSPAIDAADAGAIPGDATADRAGQPRRVDDPGMPDRGAGPPPAADMGALEFQAASCRADWDGDGQVLPSDVAAFVQSWLGGLAGGTLDGDFNFTGVVEPSDVAAFVQAWFGAIAQGC
jgi:predicted outer membrane repeat protein